MRGAKAHTSGSVVANELVIIPQRAMRAADADYAVAFAVPVDTPGIKLVCRGFSGENPDEFEAPVSSHDDLMESFTIFDDVFVPWERVFLCGEAEFAGEVANTFANVNRQGYLGADVGKLRLFIGAAQLAAELNGVTGAAHIKSKISEMIRLERSIWALGVTASHESRNEEGYQVPDPVLTNAGKHLAMEGHYMAARNLLEIAGGSVITSPYVEDIFRPELRPFVEKYYRGVDAGDAMERLRVMKLIRDLVASEYGGYWYTEIIHGSGSPEAEKLQMYREHDLDYCVGLARHALQGPGGGRRGTDGAGVVAFLHAARERGRDPRPRRGCHRQGCPRLHRAVLRGGAGRVARRSSAAGPRWRWRTSCAPSTSPTRRRSSRAGGRCGWRSSSTASAPPASGCGRPSRSAPPTSSRPPTARCWCT